MTDDAPALAAVRAWLADREAIDRTDRVPLSLANGRVLRDEVTLGGGDTGSGTHEGEGEEAESAPSQLSAGRRLDPAALAGCKAAGLDEVTVAQAPEIAVVPTGADLVQRSPGPDERVETTGFLLAQLADARGGAVTYRDVVEPVPHALRPAIQRELHRDAIVFTGVALDGPLRDVVTDLGTIDVAGVPIAPGGDVALATVRDRPVVLLPPEPVDCLVAARRVVEPLLTRLHGASEEPVTGYRARLASSVESEAGVETWHAVERVGSETVDAASEPGETDALPSVEPVADPSLAAAATGDGWIRVPADRREATAEGTVLVESWNRV